MEFFYWACEEYKTCGYCNCPKRFTYSRWRDLYICHRNNGGPLIYKKIPTIVYYMVKSQIMK
jgi:hypothetical protein